MKSNTKLELTPAQKHLIRWLKVIGMSKETTIGIMSMLDTPEKRKMMLDFLLAEYDKGNKKPTEQEVLNQLKTIVRPDLS